MLLTLRQAFASSWLLISSKITVPKMFPQKIVSGLNHVALFYALKYNTALLKYRAGTNNAPNWEATNIHLSC
jgi:hypothetical protein